MNVDFVLTGKFQTDDLESRFGHYRQMSGGNRLVSIQEILENEKKIKINSMLKLYAADGEITIKDFLFDLSSVGDLDKNLCNLDQRFVEEFPYITVSFATENLPVLVYVAGFVASKVMSKLNCSNGKKILSPGKNVINAEIDSSLNEYFNNLNRGGLTYPSSILLHTFQAL